MINVCVFVSFTIQVTQGINVEDQEHVKGEKKLKHEKLPGGKSVPSVHIKKKKENKGAMSKGAASNGSVAPNAHSTKSLKSTSSNGRAAKVTEVIFQVYLRILV